jgi:hypothetical protein
MRKPRLPDRGSVCEMLVVLPFFSHLAVLLVLRLPLRKPPPSFPCTRRVHCGSWALACVNPGWGFTQWVAVSVAALGIVAMVEQGEPIDTKESRSLGAAAGFTNSKALFWGFAGRRGPDDSAKNFGV